MKCPQAHCEFETPHGKNMAAHVALMHPALNQPAEEKPATKKTKKAEVLTNGDSINEISQAGAV